LPLKLHLAVPLPKRPHTGKGRFAVLRKPLRGVRQRQSQKSNRRLKSCFDTNPNPEAIKSSRCGFYFYCARKNIPVDRTCLLGPGSSPLAKGDPDLGISGLDPQILVFSTPGNAAKAKANGFILAWESLFININWYHPSSPPQIRLPSEAPLLHPLNEGD
jgi:hypothetical protein